MFSNISIKIFCMLSTVFLNSWLVFHFGNLFGCNFVEPCPKCSHPRAYFRQHQIRSADEPMTIFFKCCNPECGHNWREWCGFLPIIVFEGISFNSLNSGQHHLHHTSDTAAACSAMILLSSHCDITEKLFQYIFCALAMLSVLYYSTSVQC